MKPLDDKEILEMAVNLTREYRTHWDKIWTGVVKDYRLMSEGKLPQAMEAKLATIDYKYDSKLVPRMIINANNNLKAMISNAIFNRDKIVDFVGRNEEDFMRGEYANMLMGYAFDVTGYKKTVMEILEDCLETGIGFGEVEYHTEIVDVLRRGDAGEGSIIDKLMNFFVGARKPQTIYDGGILRYVRAEMLALEPVRRVENISAYSRLAIVPISKILKRAEDKNSTFYEFRENADAIKANHFVDIETNYDPGSDHDKDVNEFDTPDFKVLADVFWVNTKSTRSNGKMKWHRITVANYDTEAKLLEIAVDPLRINSHPLLVAKVFPRNNRMMGFSGPELLFDLFLEKFAKRNQRINYMNQAIELAGCLIVPKGGIANKKILPAKRGKIIELSGIVQSGKDITSVQMDMSPISMTIEEENIIGMETEETMQSSRVTRGQMPTRQEKATTVSIVDENSKILQSMPIASIEDTLIKPSSRLMLHLFQEFSDETFTIRVLGKNGYAFKQMTKDNFLGYFDVKCYGSGEILPKALKQAAFAQVAQVYGANPRCNLDVDKLAVEHMKVLEIGNATEFVNDKAKMLAEIEREETIMMEFGRPTPPLEHESHPMHITHHGETIQKLMMQGVPDNDPRIGALQWHSNIHNQMMAQMNGQTNIPTQPNVHNLGEAINSTAAISAGGVQ